MKFKSFLPWLAVLGAASLRAAVFSTANYAIVTNPSNNVADITFSNRFFNGVCTVESREAGKWVVLQNFFTTQRLGQVTLELPTNDYARLRLRTLQVTAERYTVFAHLAQSYGDIHTVAGTGERPPGTETWLPEYEGAFATNVFLNNPRYAVADAANNIYVLERDGHAVDQITPDGRIHTLVGTHHPGYLGEAPVGSNGFGPTSPLNFPGGLWLDGNRLFILDSGNSRVRFIDVDDTNKTVNPVFGDSLLTTNLTGVHVGMYTNGSGLWVSHDVLGEPTMAFYGVGNEVRRWRATGGTIVLATGFQEVGNVIVDPIGRTIVSDPGDNRVYRVRNSGAKEVVAGSGFPNGPFPRNLHYGGAAATVALPGARSVWYLPIGGYFIGLDQGAQVWYVNSLNNAVPFIFGVPGLHTGDGTWFRQGGIRGPKVGNIISVTVAPSGDIILVEAGGFVRKIDFLRHRP